jgi:hypothetical protein
LVTGSAMRLPLGQIEEVINKVVEASKKPGVMSLAGMQAEASCKREVAAYFRHLKVKIGQAHLEDLAKSTNKDQARHAAEMKARQVVRRSHDLLLNVLKRNIADALLVADKQKVLHEASISVGAASGLLSQDAEDYAATQAAQQIVGIDQTTVDLIADLVATAVGNQFTPAQLSRDLRDLMAGMSTDRADSIARTEMADAFGEAALRKLKRESIAYKQLILSPDACEICQAIADEGPVPVDEPFVDDDGEEYDRSPIHVRCRCATVGARAPQEDEGD